MGVEHYLVKVDDENKVIIAFWIGGSSARVLKDVDDVVCSKLNEVFGEISEAYDIHDAIEESFMNMSARAFSRIVMMFDKLYGMFLDDTRIVTVCSFMKYGFKVMDEYELDELREEKRGYLVLEYDVGEFDE